MSLAENAVKRPITTTMFFLIVILLGALSFTRLPIDLLPEVTYPSLTIRTDYGNVGPQEVEDLITRPIEEAVAAIAGAEEITSSSSEGRSQVRVSFTWGTDLDAAADEVRSRIDRIRGRLPDDAQPPTVFKFDLASFPILFLGVSSDAMDMIDLREFVEEQIEYRLERVAGVAAVDARGGLRRQVQVNLDRDKMLALDLSADQVTRLLGRENLNRPAGRIDEGNLDLYIRTVGEFVQAEDVAQTVVAVRNGQPIYLRDIADVREGVEEVTSLVRINREPGLFLSISKQSGGNTVEVAQGVLAEVERINKDFAGQLQLTPTIDTSQYIQQAINNVRNSAVIGGILAVIILLLFLRSGRSTLIIATTIPIAVIAAFALIYFSGFTLNIMTFGGLALGIGMLVDNAVVVLENIYRKREEGHPVTFSAVVGTKEVSAAIIASTLTTMAVFLPVVFLEGISGVMYKQLAIVVAFALFASLVAALTLIPMLSSKLLAWEEAEVHSQSGWAKKMGDLLNAVEMRYKTLVGWALDNRSVVVMGAVTLFAASLLLVPQIGTELLPKTDEGEVRVNVEMAVGTRLELLDETFLEIERIVAAEVPEARSMVTNMGGGGWRATGGHTGNLRIALVPLAERTRSSGEIAQELRGKLANIPGARLFVSEGSGLFLLRIAFGGGDNTSLQIEVRGFDLEQGFTIAGQVQEAMQQIPGVEDVRIGRDQGRPERIIRINREKIARLGLSMNQVAEIIETNIAGTRATLLRRGGREYDIFVRLDEPDRSFVTDLDKIALVSLSGDSVPLRSVIDVEFARGPVIIDRKDQERIINITANINERDLGSVAADIRAAVRDLDIPSEYAVLVGGEYQEQEEAQGQLLLAMLLALILVYMVMAAQFENLFDPFVVMFSIPLGAIGVIGMLWLTGTTFNIQSYIGMIMLVGIVVNNAIVLVDYINLMRREHGLALHEAVLESGRRRLRPILMTTLTTLLGLVPLAIGLGEGAEVQAAMARAVIGGLLVSTLITLVFIPVLYTTFAEWQLKFRERRGAAYSESDGDGYNAETPVPALPAVNS